MDRLTPQARSANMRAVRRQNTAPEMAVRRLLHAAGYRYRLHVKKLPGSPDIVFTGRRKVIFVHGCFWHGHDCRGGRRPQSNQSYWLPKIARNQQRDATALDALLQSGWQTLFVWECEIPNRISLVARITKFLGPPGSLKTPSR
jgi:DNA mismatch endonuclease (patch repair protein)